MLQASQATLITSAFPPRATTEGLELIMTQTQAGVQKSLVVFARGVEVLDKPPKACAIEL